MFLAKERKARSTLEHARALDEMKTISHNSKQNVFWSSHTMAWWNFNREAHQKNEKQQMYPRVETNKKKKTNLYQKSQLHLIHYRLSTPPRGVGGDSNQAAREIGHVASKFTKLGRKVRSHATHRANQRRGHGFYIPHGSRANRRGEVPCDPRKGVAEPARGGRGGKRERRRRSRRRRRRSEPAKLRQPRQSASAAAAAV
mmetsp:Transcript_16008/g.38968  ORF Transcript_16008/g.38968 Transcript_16008/m.38968 type:complete len:200 (-) Transcript_16008:633-1232(-)